MTEQAKQYQPPSVPGVPDEVTQEVYDHDKTDYEKAGRWESMKVHYDERLKLHRQKKADEKAAEQPAPVAVPTPTSPQSPTEHGGN